jgi:hypothetical protein
MPAERPSPERRPLTDYRVVAVDVLGPRGGLTREWQIQTGPYHKSIAEFTSRREALDELARLVNEAHAR